MNEVNEVTEVIEVKIDPEIFNRLRAAIEKCPNSGVQLEGAPIDILVPLPGNRIVMVSPEDEVQTPIEELPKVQPQSLISAAFFVGEGSNYSCCAVGGRNKCRRY